MFLFARRDGGTHSDWSAVRGRGGPGVWWAWPRSSCTWTRCAPWTRRRTTWARPAPPVVKEEPFVRVIHSFCLLSFLLLATLPFFLNVTCGFFFCSCLLMLDACSSLAHASGMPCIARWRTKIKEKLGKKTRYRDESIENRRRTHRTYLALLLAKRKAKTVVSEGSLFRFQRLQSFF